MATPLCFSLSNTTLLSLIKPKTPTPTKHPFHIKPQKPNRRLAICNTIADDVKHSSVVLEEGDNVLFSPSEEKVQVSDYDWREEWYPMYLTKDVPHDAPLGLTVFDQQVVIWKDGDGAIHCYQDRCPHRLAKLSEGQLIDGRIECLYHGWQFEGEGKCVKIPQLQANAKIPKLACVKSFVVKESQGVVWVWMSTTKPPDSKKLPWFEIFDRPDIQDISTTHELPYDHSILLENLMDPAHVPVSHDRTDWSAKREDAQALGFEVTERTDRGFAGWWGREKEGTKPNFLRFQAPCVFSNDREFVDKNGEKFYFSGIFLCRPTGQGKSMLIVRFGGTKSSPIRKVIPEWYFHQNASKIFEQDMGFLSSQNEVLIKERVPTKELYLNLRSSDTWVAEYRKWMDRVGPGMPYHFGHSTINLPKLPAVVEHAPAGFFAGVSASYPAKGGIGAMEAPNLSNRYFRHVIHCRSCSKVVKGFTAWKNAFAAVALALTALAILVNGRQWKTLLLVSATFCLAGFYACSTAVSVNTTNFIRTHRRL